MKNFNRLTTTLLLSALGLIQASGSAYAVKSSDRVYGPNAQGPEGYARVLATGDFNGDGYPDQAVSNPSLSIHNAPTNSSCSAHADCGLWVQSAGSINIKYGSQSGFAGFEQVLDFETPGFGEIFNSQHFARIGSALAVGHFNDDDYQDLAIGFDNDNLQGQVVGGVQMYGAGSVVILYGSIFGLTASGAKKFHQDTPGIGGACEGMDSFGISLAAGDFNKDSFDDLAVGVPLEDIGDEEDAGMVHILFGSANGLTSSGDLTLHQNTPHVPGSCEEGDLFGHSLAVGDFDDDGYADLAVGVPGEDLGLLGSDAGMVNLFMGHAGGLSPSSTSLKQRSPFFLWSVTDSDYEAFDKFGLSLAAGNLDGEHGDELVVGVPGETINSNKLFAGAIQVYSFSTGSELSITSNRLYSQDSYGIQGAAETADSFGEVLAMGDLNGDGYDDIAVGIPSEKIGSIYQAGMVHLLFGSSDATSGLTWDRVLHQNSTGNPASSEAYDQFGRALCIADFNGDGYMDLTVGVPNEVAANNPVVQNEQVRGIIQVFEGSSAGPVYLPKTWNAHSS